MSYCNMLYTYMQIALGNILKFRKKNWQFDIIGGFIYFVLAFSMFPQVTVRLRASSLNPAKTDLHHACCYLIVSLTFVVSLPPELSGILYRFVWLFTCHSKVGIFN